MGCALGSLVAFLSGVAGITCGALVMSRSWAGGRAGSGGVVRTAVVGNVGAGGGVGRVQTVDRFDAFG